MRCGVMCVCPVSLACFQGTGRVCQTLALRKRHSGPSCQLSASCLSPARRSPPASRIHWSRTPRPRLRAKPRVRGAPRRHARGSGNARQPAPEVARAASRRRAGRAAGGAPAALTPPSGDPPDTHPSHWLRSARDTASPAARCPLLPSLPPSARRCWRRGNGGGASGGGGGGVSVSVRWGGRGRGAGAALPGRRGRVPPWAAVSAIRAGRAAARGGCGEARRGAGKGVPGDCGLGLAGPASRSGWAGRGSLRGAEPVVNRRQLGDARGGRRLRGGRRKRRLQAGLGPPGKGPGRGHRRGGPGGSAGPECRSARPS